MNTSQQLENARDAFKQEENKNKELVFKYFKNISTEPIKLSYFNTHTSSYWPRVRIDLSFLDNEGITIYGSDLTLSYYSDKGLTLDHSSMGEYSLTKSNPQLTRLKMLNSILNHTQEIEDLFKNLDLSKQAEFIKIELQTEAEQEAIRRAELANKRAKIQADLEVNKKFIIESYGQVRLYYVGPKQVKFDYTWTNNCGVVIDDAAKMDRSVFVELIIKAWSYNYAN